MRQLVIGILIGSALTGSLVWAGTFYDSNGNVQAPRGSTQQFDYFRQRQQFLDIQHMRQQQDRDRLDKQVHPCAK